MVARACRRDSDSIALLASGEGVSSIRGRYSLRIVQGSQQVANEERRKTKDERISTMDHPRNYAGRRKREHRGRQESELLVVYRRTI